MKKFICIHGHFYQPPRENPWTGDVDAEESAKPYHDWNERIAHECYAANTRAPILNAKGETAFWVNNFSKINFDIGPTLLSWLKRKDINVYRAIIDADRQSVQAHGGHGNAMAQSYNHIIMPLAKRRDKITQIVWGIEDFVYHYGRKPEGMWLSEAAVDKETLKLMADRGILYTVLAPHQARRFRRIGFAQRWENAHNDSIDTKHSYRVLLDHGKQFHVFFYDAPISRAMAFQGLLHNGDTLIQRFLNSYGRREPVQLVSTATDGETFGHHHRHGEMAIAYATKKIEDQKLAKLTNYAEFLDKYGSRWEVDLYEKSSWSCAHGVERWRADCGCRLHHGEGWNQAWRAVLREAFDWLQEQVDHVFEAQTSALLKDPWQARNEYIMVMLDPSDKVKKRFLSKQGRRQASPEDEARIWDLLEAQKFSLFMYTSCGWFFDDISGIEPVQVMKFACRALELVQPYLSQDLEGPFLKILSKAKSNIAEQGNGADIYKRHAKTAKPGQQHTEIGVL